MIFNFEKNFNEVLSKFYVNCGLDSFYLNEKRVINKINLKKSLISLAEEDLINDVQNQKCDIITFISKRDKILHFRETDNYFINLNHKIKVLGIGDHAFPYLCPKKSIQLIEKLLKKKKFF